MFEQAGSPDCFFFFSVSVVAETEVIQALLRDNGIDVQTVSEVQPIRIMSARILSHIYVKLGKDSACLLVKYFTTQIINTSSPRCCMLYIHPTSSYVFLYTSPMTYSVFVHAQHLQYK